MTTLRQIKLKVKWVRNFYFSSTSVVL